MEEQELFDRLCAIRDSTSDRMTMYAVNDLIIERWGKK